MGKTKLLLIIVGGLIALCLLFGIIGAFIGGSDTAPTKTPTEIANAPATEPPVATNVASTPPAEAATPTAEPTTPAPTPTPEPPTPTPQPIFQGATFSGTGDDIIDLKGVPETPLLLTITHSGQMNFIVQAYDDDNNLIDLIVNSIGSYEGKRPLNFGYRSASRLSIKADGHWTIQIDDISKASAIVVPGKLSGHGDDVILLQGEKPDTITLTHNGEMNFIVTAFSSKARLLNLIVNEIGPYQGKNLLPANTKILVVQADGDWTIDITSR